VTIFFLSGNGMTGFLFFNFSRKNGQLSRRRNKKQEREAEGESCQRRAQG
jgi:hypothetical protein